MHVHAIYLLCITAAAVLLGFAAIVFFCRVSTSPSKIRDLAIRGVVVAGSTVIFILTIETYWYFTPSADGFRFTLASERWFELHWNPINTLGYRDKEYTRENTQGKNVCIVVGDSMAIGEGIVDADDRFAGVLDRLLGDEWVVPVVAAGGWDTSHELGALKRYPIKPSVVVLEYYPNDIIRSAQKFRSADKSELKAIPDQPTGVIGAISEHSYFFNWVYWIFYRAQLTQQQGSYWDRVSGHFNDDKIWQHHVTSINKFGGYAKSNDIDLFVLIIPNLFDVSGSAPITAKVAKSFSASGAVTLDLAHHLRDRNPSDMVVNSLNGHVNEAISIEIAGWIYDGLKGAGFVESNSR